MKYFLNPQISKDTELANTDLINIKSHRLKALILEDLSNYPNLTISEIHNRIGYEIPIRNIRTCLYNDVKNDEIKCDGGKKFRKYFINRNKGEK